MQVERRKTLAPSEPVSTGQREGGRQGLEEEHQTSGEEPQGSDGEIRAASSSPIVLLQLVHEKDVQPGDFVLCYTTRHGI